MENKYHIVSQEERDRWLIIENVKTWVLPKIPNLHPDSVKHTQLWREYSKRCIEGFWGLDFGKYRFMPPKLYYYINFFTIVHEEDGKPAVKMRPMLRDLEWEIFYMFFIAKGFSGFTDDDEYSCNSKIIDYNKGNVKIELLHRSCINKDGKVKQYLDPLTYARMLHEYPKGKPLYLNTPRNIMLFGSRSSGKLLLPTAKIRVKDGWTTMQDIQPGDLVYGLDGNLCPVTYKTDLQKNVNMYEVTLRDGRKIKCCEDHLWYVWDKNKARNNQFAYVTKPTKELYNTYSIASKKKKEKGSFESRYAIPVNNPLLEETEKPVPLHPYVLGVLLGDGGMTQRNVVITSADEEIVNRVNSLLPEGYVVNKMSDKYGYIIARKDKSVRPFIYYLNDLGLSYKKSEFKFIPDIYKFNSYENKLELIKGLMDTDGTCDNRNSIEYYTSSKQLSDDFQEILRSIGINCHTRIKKTSYVQKNGIKKDCLDCYRSTVFTDQPIFSLERKLSYTKHTKNKLGQSKYEKSFIVNIEPCGTDKGYCISVDNPTNTYITDDYIVTHNTYGISGVSLHEIIFAGETSYDEYLSKKQKDSLEEAGLCIGAASSGKSAQFFKYMEESMRQYSINSDLGVWGKLGQDDDYEPCPFYREMVGETKPNNAKSPWRDEYKVKHNGKEVIKGSRSFAKHVNYKDDSEAAASGRYNYNIIEEIGLLEDSPTAWVSNEFTVSRGVKKVASLVGLGTSGVIEKVEGAKQIFLNPFTYDCVPYKDYLEHNGQQGYTGFFIPAYMINMDFKDENGNTDIQAAKKYAWDKLETLKDNPVQYRAYCMHNPLLISHMWINSKGDMLPVEEASLREKELMVKNKYKELMLPVKLIWNSATQSGVEYRPDETLKPIINPYTEGQDSDAEGCVVIYQKPEYNKYGKIYPDQYFYLHDPYVSNITGDSLGVVYVISNPKYIPEGLSGNEIVASYIGKNPKGKDAYTEEMEKLIQLYGNCPGMLWYEANRGEDVRNYFNNRNKQALLCVRPQLAKGTKGNMVNVRDNGYMVGNLVAKISMIDNFADWLKQISNSEEGKLNIEVIPCLYLLRQIQMYNTDDNFDGVSAMLGYPLALKEFTSFQRTETIKKSNPHSFLINNDFIGRVR